MPIELRHLRYIVAAEKHGSFRRAATALRLKQSTLSRRIHQLEDELGVLLFARHSGGVRPTTAGLEFLRRARRVTEEVQTMTGLAKAQSRGEAGRLSVGFYSSLSAGHLRATLNDYLELHPGVSFSAVEESRDNLFADLESGTIDILIVSGEVASPGETVLPLWAERIMVALPERHRLALSEVVYWTDLKCERFLLSHCDPGPEMQNLVVAKLGAPGERPHVDRHRTSRETILSMVGIGCGITLLCSAETGVLHEGVTYREVREGNGPSLIGQSACWRADNANPALLRFVDVLRARYPVAKSG